MMIQFVEHLKRVTSSSPTPPGSFVALSAGDATTCAVEDTGNVLCWGSNTNNVATPPAGSFVDLSVGTDHACAIDGGGALQCWGDDGFGKAI